MARCVSYCPLCFVRCIIPDILRSVAKTKGRSVVVGERSCCSTPGFTQQPIALTYLPHHVSFLLFVLSLMFTVLSITRPAYRWLLLPLALTTEGLSYVIIEYFVGLELLRVVLIGVVSDRQRTLGSLKAKVTAALISWSPYAAVWIGYIVWRAVFMQAGPTESYKNVGSDVSRVLSSPLHAAAARVFDGIHNVCMATVFAWTRPFRPDLIMFSSGSIILAWAVGAIVALIAIYMLRRLAGVSGRSPSPSQLTTDSIIYRSRASCWVLPPFSLPVATRSFRGSRSIRHTTGVR